MRLDRFLLTAAAVAGVVACGPAAEVSQPEDRAPTTAATEPVPVTRLRTEPVSFMGTSGLRTAQRTVIGDETAWRAAWSVLWTGAVPVPTLPLVDFAREVIVLVALGERPTGGYQIFVDSATTGVGGTVVYVRTVSPGARCGRFQVLTQPVDLARLHRMQGPLTFRDRAVVMECP